MRGDFALASVGQLLTSITYAELDASDVELRLAEKVHEAERKLLERALPFCGAAATCSSALLSAPTTLAAVHRYSYSPQMAVMKHAVRRDLIRLLQKTDR